ncbi:MAG: hypothetical protein AAGA77_17825 [Bacteroidota bacterium]
MKTNEPKRPYKDDNLFTYKGKSHGNGYTVELQDTLGPPNGYEQFDLGIIEVDEEGQLSHPKQLENIGDRIRSVREQDKAIVVGFIHGWHNNADWDNAFLKSFRKLLKALLVRELEAHRRRVIGVYIGWNGRSEEGFGKWIGRIPLINVTTFRDRYRAAERTGQGEALSETLVELTSACKMPLGNSDPVPLILIGHSMGAFILQNAFLELLKHPGDPLVLPTHRINYAVTTKRSDDEEVLAPDLLLSLNSAADSNVAKNINKWLLDKKWEKRFETSKAEVKVAPYNPPLLISATSSNDLAVGFFWKIGQLSRKSSTTGFDKAIATHNFKKSKMEAKCEKAEFPDFYQPWHCLHKDNRPGIPTPCFAIDLPDHDRSKNKDLTHTRYLLTPKERDKPSLFWSFQVPGDIIDGHSDIFNYKAASFTLALIQLSGVLASAPGDGWDANFSEETLDCD